MGKDLCDIDTIGKDVLIDRLVKTHILKIFITGDICLFGLD